MFTVIFARCSSRWPHDFNNLLTAVSGSLELLSRRIADRPDLHRFVAVAQAGAARGAKLTGQLLAFARRQPLSPKLIDINVQLQDFLPLLRGAVGDAVELVFSPSDTAQACMVDPSQLEVAVLNLAVNARDASPANGKIDIVIDERLIDGRRYSCVLVRDRGHGMSPETLERAVEPFFTTKDVGAGTGLGLSQVYGFADQSGGRLELESQVGAGTVARILLPRAELGVGTYGAQEELQRPFVSRAILLVEDEEPVRMIAAEALREAGYSVIEASDGYQALALVEGGIEIDALVTDVSMPRGMSGIELAQRIRSSKATIPVLLTSGYAEALLDETHRFPLLSKPYSAMGLVSRTEKLFDAD